VSSRAARQPTDVLRGGWRPPAGPHTRRSSTTPVLGLANTTAASSAVGGYGPERETHLHRTASMPSCVRSIEPVHCGAAGAGECGGIEPITTNILSPVALRVHSADGGVGLFADPVNRPGSVKRLSDGSNTVAGAHRLNPRPDAILWGFGHGWHLLRQCCSPTLIYSCTLLDNLERVRIRSLFRRIA